MNGRTVWLRFWYLWAPPAALLVLNVVWLAGIRGTVLGRGSLLDRLGTDARADVARLEAQSRALDQTAVRLTNLKENLATLRARQMAPMRDRLVPFLTDLVQRTEQAGLRAERVAYAVRREKKSGLAYFTARFEVKGAYDQIRRCVFLLETSPQFVLLEGLALRGESSAASLGIGVQLSVGTYFSDIDEGLMKKLGISEVASGE